MSAGFRPLFLGESAGNFESPDVASDKRLQRNSRRRGLKILGFSNISNRNIKRRSKKNYYFLFMGESALRADRAAPVFGLRVGNVNVLEN